MIDSTLMQYELRFQSLFDSGRGYAFPCDSRGRVDLNQLSDRARINYLFARAVVGRELAVPAVHAMGMPLGKQPVQLASRDANLPRHRGSDESRIPEM